MHHDAHHFPRWNQGERTEVISVPEWSVLQIRLGSNLKVMKPADMINEPFLRMRNMLFQIGKAPM
ncbi:hypothetical protein, partial [Pedobacter antarcticus]|uniref:hypothetical protein n=1 Tax=Pedobacter antarcticus TaxID=34086 RepID=UPI0005655759